MRIANFSSRLRARKGSSEMMGRMMSETSELAQAVKAAARLYYALALLSDLKKELVNLHQSNSYLKHVIAQRKVAEAVPRAPRASAHSIFCVAKILLCGVV